MKAQASFALILYVASVQAVDIFLWKPADNCGGGGIVCTSIPSGQCCFDGNLYGSGEVYNPNKETGVTQLFSRKASSNNNCAFGFSAVKPIPVCIESGLDQSVSGMAWEFRRTSKREEEHLQPCTSNVLGDPVYSDGTTIWVISRDKMNEFNRKIPENDAEALDFFKLHADRTLSHQDIRASMN